MPKRRAKKRFTGPPECPACKALARLTNGREIYPHRPDLAEQAFWKCDGGCGGHVGCHPRSTDPLGTPANGELRRARSILHEQLIDPLWREADRTGLYEPESDHARHLIRTAARGRVYGYLADKLGIARADTHTGMFDLETCRRAWRALIGVKYADIRDWAKAQKAAEQ